MVGPIYSFWSFGVSQIFMAFLNYQKINSYFFYNNDNNNIYRRAKRIQIPISVHYPIFSTRHRNHFEQQMSKSSSFTMHFEFHDIFRCDIFSAKQMKLLELNCKAFRLFS